MNGKNKGYQNYWCIRAPRDQAHDKMGKFYNKFG